MQLDSSSTVTLPSEFTSAFLKTSSASVGGAFAVKSVALVVGISDFLRCLWLQCKRWFIR
eukprot:5372920-Pyramimonas_sp.AAC.1